MFKANFFQNLFNSNLKKIIILSLVIVFIFFIIVFLTFEGQTKKEIKINYLIYQNQDGLYLEYPNWIEYNSEDFKKNYPKELIKKNKLNVVKILNDPNGAQFAIIKRDYFKEIDLKEAVDNLERDYKRLIPSFKILDKKISNNSVEIKAKFRFLRFDMLMLIKGILINLRNGKRFYNVSIVVVKNKLKDYQKIIDHIFNSLRIEKINKKQN